MGGGELCHVTRPSSPLPLIYNAEEYIYRRNEGRKAFAKLDMPYTHTIIIPIVKSGGAVPPTFQSVCVCVGGGGGGGGGTAPMSPPLRTWLCQTNYTLETIALWSAASCYVHS